MKKIFFALVLIAIFILLAIFSTNKKVNFQIQSLHYDQNTKILTHCYPELDFCQSEFYEPRPTEAP